MKGCLGIVAVLAVADAYVWTNFTAGAKAMPAAMLVGGHAKVGFQNHSSDLGVCRALNAYGTKGAAGWTPGSVGLYDTATTEPGWHCANCQGPGYCYLYDPSTQALVSEAGDAFSWVAATGAVPAGAVEAGAWGDGPAFAYWVCRVGRGADVLPGFIWFHDNRYECCAALPQDNPSQVCAGAYEALVHAKET